ncbi:MULTISPECIES: peptidylprolyl isomerase [Chitinilyticum]|uniref:peptidylprolyl isomerase n=1 Tax=Chitinilyticum piscinae TaxID=2866724 RepID=A0A8J7G2Q3_9NEIS|nr:MULTISPECIES: peptidylprolyl isomerase [Chitinilyticum]MBE9610940.1 peptidylprolyl isomerase [Chitinilyticum piscinae]
MAILVNDIEITDDMIEAELPHHQQAAKPLDAAVQELILREILRQEAASQGFAGENAIADLLESAVSIPDADEAACRQWYEQHPQAFVQGELVAASHILFQVTDTVPLDLLRAKAEEVLADTLSNPEAFGQYARQYSNCPSGEVGGNLGQFGRGEMVPEFEKVVFALDEGAIAPRLVETRFGLHIVRCERKVEGIRAPFEAVQQRIADYLGEAATRQAMNHYLRLLAGKARIEGFELAGADSPLLQ